MSAIHSNEVTSRHVVLKLIVNNGSLEDIQNFVTKSICQLYPVPDDVVGCNMPCSIVGTEVNISASDRNTGDKMMVFVAYRAWGETANDIIANSVEKNLVVTREQLNAPEYKLFSALDLAQFFRESSERPENIRLMGISGTSEKYGSQMWNEIVTDSRSWLSGSGEGCGMHAMSMFDPSFGDVYYTNECSHIFNWEV